MAHLPPSLRRVASLSDAERLRDAPGSDWRTQSAREAYRNPWLTVTEFQVTRPDGSPGLYGVVDPGDNVSIVAMTDDVRVWVVEDFIYPLQARSWFLPTGAMEPDEDPLAAAQRELEEETGLRAASWRELGAFYLSPGISTQRSYLYLARELSLGAHRREATEAGMTARSMPLREARDASLTNPLASAVTALGLQLAWNVLHSEL